MTTQQAHRQAAAVREVAASTLAAAHRRDHQHPFPALGCSPHPVEVIGLGDRAVMVCHDCQQDTGFLPLREAERRAHEHRRQTRSAPDSEVTRPVTHQHAA